MTDEHGTARSAQAHNDVLSAQAQERAERIARERREARARGGWTAPRLFWTIAGAVFVAVVAADLLSWLVGQIAL